MGYGTRGGCLGCLTLIVLAIVVFLLVAWLLFPNGIFG
jgi:hypothetical protein